MTTEEEYTENLHSGLIYDLDCKTDFYTYN